MKHKHFLPAFILLVFSLQTLAQTNNVGIGTTSPDASAALDITATNKGMLIPRMTTAQRTAIASPANGLLVFDINTKSFWFFAGNIWNGIAATAPIPLTSGSNNNPFAIPDNNPTGVQSTITLAQPGIIEASTQIKLCLNITHVYDADLDISLIAPDGTTIDLSSDNGGTGDNYTNTCFTTSATTSILTGAPPFTGDWIPEQPFSNFLTKAIAGIWTLKVVDDAASDVGTLNSWSLEFPIHSAAPSGLSDKDGDTRIQVEKNPDEDIIRFDLAGAEKMIIQTNGNVGIGTNAPASKLDVEGGMSIGASYSGTSAAPTNGAIIEGYVGIGTNAPASKLDVEGGMSIGASYSGTSAAPTNGAIIQGNVGIGTATPNARLHIEGGALLV